MEVIAESLNETQSVNPSEREIPDSATRIPTVEPGRSQRANSFNAPKSKVSGPTDEATRRAMAAKWRK
jgi:hypothetical protein